MRHVNSNDGTRIAYGYIEGADPVLLFAPVAGHQFSIVEHVPAWRQFRDAFRRQNASAILDWRGTGLSGAAPGTCSGEQMADDLAAVVADIDRPVVLTAHGIDGAGPALTVAIDDPRVVALALHHPSLSGIGVPGLHDMLRVSWEAGLYAAARLVYGEEDTVLLRRLTKELPGLAGRAGIEAAVIASEKEMVAFQASQHEAAGVDWFEELPRTLRCGHARQMNNGM